MLDYTSSAAYETGYLDRHIRNGWLYSELDRLFADKTAVGARIYEYKHKLATAELAGADSEYMQNLLFSTAARAAAANGIPTVYCDEGNSAGILFGENARQLPDDKLGSGLVLDLTAAEILMGRGIDVGIEAVGDYFQPNEEHGFGNHSFIQSCDEHGLGSRDCVLSDAEHHINSEYIPWRCGRVRRIKLKETAEICSNFVVDGEDYSPSFYYYTNKSGQRFAVICADARACGEPLWRSYLRQSQLICALNELGGQPLPVYCSGEPDVYIIAKRSGNRLAVGIWNLSPDEIFDAELVFPLRSVTLADTVDCAAHSANADGQSGRLVIERLLPYRAAAVEVELSE